MEEIRASLRLCEAAYDAARQVIQPGETEIGVYLAMNTAIVQAYGASGDVCRAISLVGNGRSEAEVRPPTGFSPRATCFRLDLFPAPALYFGDTCRTFCVGEPTDAQTDSWKLACDALALGESLIKPGAAAEKSIGSIKEFLDNDPITEKSFWHHAGHGIGLHGQEAPRIIQYTDDVLSQAMYSR